MEQISKKELLAKTGISYGQLYRWKRENLIPESWFIKQSSYTGQETFFPKAQILKRVETILQLKDQYSLEELAKMLSPESSANELTMQTLFAIAEIRQDLLPQNLKTSEEPISFFKLILISALSELITETGLTGNSAETLMKKALVFDQVGHIDATLIVFQTQEASFFVLGKGTAMLQFDADITILGSRHLEHLADTIKQNYQSLFIKSI